MERSRDPRRKRMVRRQLAARGITDRRVLAAMAAVPRERFVPLHLFDKAYDDSPLPVGYDQTISQPYIVALMTQEARLTRRSSVLEVGTGTGYHTAILATLARHVWSVERLSGLSHDARGRLELLGIHNVTLVVGDGALGYPEAAPFDAIVVAAAAPSPPRPLLDQLAMGGRMVIPIGDLALQEMVIVERSESGYRERHAGPCRFVPLVSAEAFGEA
ncbi:MAG: protein-L-isoaspartate(D-aspartate) O-methyltransferase [Gemmatimonadales bacterium]